MATDPNQNSSEWVNYLRSMGEEQRGVQEQSKTFVNTTAPYAQKNVTKEVDRFTRLAEMRQKREEQMGRLYGSNVDTTANTTQRQQATLGYKSQIEQLAKQTRREAKFAIEGMTVPSVSLWSQSAAALQENMINQYISMRPSGFETAANAAINLAGMYAMMKPGAEPAPAQPAAAGPAAQNPSQWAGASDTSFGKPAVRDYNPYNRPGSAFTSY